MKANNVDPLENHITLLVCFHYNVYFVGTVSTSKVLIIVKLKMRAHFFD